MGPICFSKSKSTGAKTPLGKSLLIHTQFMAPEVASSWMRGEAADIFSLGCVFVEMYTVISGTGLRNLETHMANLCDVYEKDHPEYEAFRDYCAYYNNTSNLVAWVEKLGLPEIVDLVYENPDKRPSAKVVWHRLSCPGSAGGRSTCGPCCKEGNA
jgi:hypothetical protein